MTLQYLDQGKSRLGSDAAIAGVDLRCLTLRVVARAAALLFRLVLAAHLMLV